jgi:hypothetical protein
MNSLSIARRAPFQKDLWQVNLSKLGGAARLVLGEKQPGLVTGIEALTVPITSP